MLSPLLATIPYKTMPVIELGPLTLRTFGLMTALGVVLGAWYAAVHAEQYGMTRDDTYRLGTRMVIAGVIGSRVTWVLTHLDQVDSIGDAIAIWEGGLQFSGGFIVAIAVGLPTFLSWNRLQRWQLLDGFAVAVLVGAAFGRIGCLSVGEHFGRESSFALATRFEGAINLPPGEQPLRETTLGPDGPVIVPGTSFLNPALYEMVTCFVLFGLLAWYIRRRPTPGTVGGIFLLAYAVQRFAWDALRVNDERVAGMTGAQWMCLAMVPIGIYVLAKVRPAMGAALEAGEVGGEPVGDALAAQARAEGRIPPVRKKGGAASAGSAAAGDPASDDTDGDGDDGGTVLVDDERRRRRRGADGRGRGDGRAARSMRRRRDRRRRPDGASGPTEADDAPLGRRRPRPPLIPSERSTRCPAGRFCVCPDRWDRRGATRKLGVLGRPVLCLSGPLGAAWSDTELGCPPAGRFCVCPDRWDRSVPTQNDGEAVRARCR